MQQDNKYQCSESRLREADSSEKSLVEEKKFVEGPSKALDLIRTTNFTVGRTMTFSSSLEVSVGCSLWKKLATFLFELKLEFLLQL